MIGKIFFLAFIGLTLADQRANQYIDNVIQSALPQALHSLGLDPAPISDFSTTFGVQDIYQNVGEAFFSQGNLTNLRGVRRSGDCSGPRSVRGEITVNCTLRFTQLLTAYKVILRNGSYVYFPRNMGHMAETLASVVISGQPQNYIGSVKSFKVDRLGAITPTFNPLPSVLNKYLRVLQEAYRAHVSTEVFNVIQQKFVYALGRALSGTPMPRP